MNGRQTHQLYGETIREIGLLMLVFGPLDTIVKEQLTMQGLAQAGVIATIGLLLIFIGIELERP